MRAPTTNARTQYQCHTHAPAAAPACVRTHQQRQAVGVERASGAVVDEVRLHPQLDDTVQGGKAVVDLNRGGVGGIGRFVQKVSMAHTLHTTRHSSIARPRRKQHKALAAPSTSKPRTGSAVCWTRWHRAWQGCHHSPAATQTYHHTSCLLKTGKVDSCRTAGRAV